ncbi:hypothetical protein [Halobellus salinisoli]|uniref:hypothetical protein n=1 Tax=Halobellus salinisoli TaxID=3108500 RepID=UPI0030082329
MSHRQTGRNLTEWADLIGASLPDSVEERESVSGELPDDGFGGGFRERIVDRSDYEFTAEPDENG